MQVLKSVTFVYAPKEDRILAVANVGTPGAWSCWLTRRWVLQLLERGAEILARTSSLAQRAPVDIRGAVVAFERDSAIAATAKAISPTPPGVVAASETVAELVERLTIASQGENFRVELRGERGGAVTGVVQRAELQRILQMLQTEVVKANWRGTPVEASAAHDAEKPLPSRH